MKNDIKDVGYRKWLLPALLFISCLSYGQIPHFAQVPILRPGDSANIVHLINTGVKIQKQNIVAWFPKDSLPQSEMNKLVDTFAIGVKAAEAFIKAPFPWQAHQKNTPYTYYFRLDSFVAHASGAGFVSIPFWRIKYRQAPWLHEAVHEMLYSKEGNWANTSISRQERSDNDPLWLAEGLPDYISIEVSEKLQLPLFDVFSNSYRTNIDSICKEDLKTPQADRVVSSIGKKGIMPELFGTERRLYIAPFYHCSCSFIKHIAETYGLEPLLTSLSSFGKEHEVLEQKTSQTIEYMKSQWLNKLKDN